ncbi:Poly ADP ribose polymerase [Fasciola hepatica]|uniref:NAD(+) ADP-ribosyltransferase n=1 Tax=Fasciola hepatica TaxID=6192 RepID=A0A4E0R9U1_FASHE|nr:Poly ADP ribose polymerase [Fasciola hepatica]
MEVDYNFQAEYAKSGRSGCLKCKTNIPQNSLRIAILVQAPTFDGKIPRWFHFQCFFGKNTKLRSTAEIKNFDSIRWEDQERIRKAISDLNGNVSADESKFAIKLSAPNMDCTKCKQELLKERHMIVAGDGKSGESYHLSCFSKSGLCTSGIDTENGKRPTADSTDTPAAKKAKLKNGDKATQPSQDALKAQSKLLWKLRDNLEREVSKDALIGLLEYNEQFVPTGVSNLLDAVADAMLFGALTRCPSCKAESLHYKNGQYKCGGMVNGWTPCLFTTQEPKRVPFNVPKEYHDVDFL